MTSCRSLQRVRNPHQALHDAIKRRKRAKHRVVDTSFNMGNPNWLQTSRSGCINMEWSCVNVWGWLRKNLASSFDHWMKAPGAQFAGISAKMLATARTRSDSKMCFDKSLCSYFFRLVERAKNGHWCRAVGFWGQVDFGKSPGEKKWWSLFTDGWFKPQGLLNLDTHYNVQWCKWPVTKLPENACNAKFWFRELSWKMLKGPIWDSWPSNSV